MNVGSCPTYYTHPKKVQPFYLLDAVPYVPHFRQPGLYVRPGHVDEPLANRIKTREELEASGATTQYASLWQREGRIS